MSSDPRTKSSQQPTFGLCKLFLFFLLVIELSIKVQKTQLKYIRSIQEIHLARKIKQVKKNMKTKQIKISKAVVQCLGVLKKNDFSSTTVLLQSSNLLSFIFLTTKGRMKPSSTQLLFEDCLPTLSKKRKGLLLF